MNEDRRRFLTALGLGLGFCEAGNHAVPDAFEVDGINYCRQHPAPSGDPDPLQPGYCQVGRIHFSREGVRYIPSRHIFACPRHYAAIVREVVRRGGYGL